MLDVARVALVAQRAADAEADPDVVDRCYAALRGAVDEHGTPMALAVWGLCAGRVLDTGPGGILVWCTGTYVEAGGCTRREAYAARDRIVALVGEWEIGDEIAGHPGRRPKHLRVHPGARVAAGILAGELHASGALPAALEGLCAAERERFRLDARETSRGGIVARCPAHDDQTASLSGVLRGDRGGARCHAAGCGARFALRRNASGVYAILANQPPGSEARGTAVGAVVTRDGSPPRGAGPPGGTGIHDHDRDPHCMPRTNPWRPDPVRAGPSRAGRVTMRLDPAHPERARHGTMGDSEACVYGLRRGGRAAYIRAFQTREQCYESVGFLAAAADDWKTTPHGRFPVRYSVSGGTDRAIVDLDRLTPGTAPDGSDPGLVAAQAAIREAARDDGWLADVVLVETGPDGVQARLVLADRVDDEDEWYASPMVRAWLEEWGERIRAAIARGGVIDRSVWRPRGYCRRPGWRWSTRVGRMFRARIVDEVSMKSAAKFARETEELRIAAGLDPVSAARLTEHRRGYAAPRPRAMPPDPIPRPVIPQPSPLPADVAAALVADLGGKAWQPADGRRTRVYWSDHAWVEIRFPVWDGVTWRLPPLYWGPQPCAFERRALRIVRSLALSPEG